MQSFKGRSLWGAAKMFLLSLSSAAAGAVALSASPAQGAVCTGIAIGLMMFAGAAVSLWWGYRGLLWKVIEIDQAGFRYSLGMKLEREIRWSDMESVESCTFKGGNRGIALYPQREWRLTIAEDDLPFEKLREVFVTTVSAKPSPAIIVKDRLGWLPKRERPRLVVSFTARD